MTYLQLVNKVLTKLRETEVSDVHESTYSKLIGEFVNEAKEEVEDSWDWTMLRQDISITTAASTTEYTITGMGERFDILQALNITRDSVMSRTGYAYIKRQLLLGTQSESSPSHYNIFGVDSAGDPKVTVYPTPNAVETLTFNAVVRQVALSDDADILLIPSSPVILGAYYRAVKERGEDSGDNSSQAAADYAKVWTSALARDVAQAEEETEWQVS